jgi:beta-N-acetylhexosaminidase
LASQNDRRPAGPTDDARPPGHWWSLACVAIAGGAIATITLGWNVRNPALSEGRPWPLIGALCAGGFLVLVTWTLKRHRPHTDGWWRFLARSSAVLSGAALAMPLIVESGHQWDRQTVRNTDPERIALLGHHLIAGFGDWDEITALVERRAIGGIFIRRHNVAGQSAAEIARRIETLQAIRHRQGLTPLWVATDQEGGPVARLSPPLAAQPTLRSALADAASPELRNQRITAYATQQAQGLASLGINLNFAPVVDLDWGIVNPADRYTKINARVIAKDPHIVGDIAARYCAASHAQGVGCTLKHFPGIGRVFEDTHRQSATLDVPLSELEQTDFIPFRRVLGDPVAAPVLMLSHVTVTALDNSNPASHSIAVVRHHLRGTWGFNGVIVTDDMCMGAIYASWAGIGRSSVHSLNAGVDLILIAWDSAQFYPVMAALLRAQDRGQLDENTLVASRQRQSRAISALQLRLPDRTR